ncbi:MAG: alpha/beta fold hydrolase, partial [Actinomadura rubrobrunea]|nr:alpha/beta fold hydrolase [Actinomadura rubrobrunea]
RIGSLFVNPGGPGGQGTAMAYEAPLFLSDEVLDRFDIVGFDPRGVGFSDNVKCFKSHKDQTEALAGMNVAFPWGAEEERAFIASAKALGKGCATTGRRLAGAMSTAQVARDMDVLRRAVGDEKLTYLGFSYGTALGQYYANMFPDRVRAVSVDGVIDPRAWVGSRTTADQILDDRMRSGDGAYKALHEMLVRCRKAGPSECNFAQFGDPVKNFDTLAERVKAEPVDFGDFTLTYADMVGAILGWLYQPNGFMSVDYNLTDLWKVVSSSVPEAQREAAKKAMADRIARQRAEVRRQDKAAEKAADEVSAQDFPYDNTVEVYSGVICTDGRHRKRAESWPAKTAQADERAPYFGRPWGWSTVQCAGNAWSVRDEDAYTGPFDRRTSAPLLIVGNYYDPATNYDAAVAASRLVPNSRLLSSDSWGHTAYGTSACVTNAVDRYLVDVALPAEGTVCVGDLQPFGVASAAARTERGPAGAAALAAPNGPARSGKRLPPVAPPLPESVLLGTR